MTNLRFAVKNWKFFMTTLQVAVEILKEKFMTVLQIAVKTSRKNWRFL
ncbi:MAG: hypothetical protein U9N18_00325 [Campylobacterota bacterium]|nr:hypothetical protein [Campylobacterota bacterium]